MKKKQKTRKPKVSIGHRKRTRKGHRRIVVRKTTRKRNQPRRARKRNQPRRAAKFVPFQKRPGRKPEVQKAEPVEPFGPNKSDETRDRDPLSLYLREIGQIPLLSLEEERQLARRIRKGDAAAREQMIRANLRLVVKLARGYENLGIPLLDLINEGNIGLMKAVERFNPRKAKLSTYAAWWIKQSIKRALANQGKLIRLPVHVVDKLLRIRRAENALQERLEHEPTNEEIAEEMGMDPFRVQMIREAAHPITSLDAPVGDESSETFAEVIADERAVGPDVEVERKAVHKIIRELVDGLDERSRQVIRLRYGMDGGNPRTLEHVGKRYGVTRERIRQIQDKVLRQLHRRIMKMENNGHAGFAECLVRGGIPESMGA